MSIPLMMYMNFDIRLVNDGGKYPKDTATPERSHPLQTSSEE
jgi:hypothetical protein